MRPFLLLISALLLLRGLPASPLSPVRVDRIAPHPRLLFTEKALAEALQAAQTDPLRAALHRRIVTTAQASLDASLPRHLPPGDASLDQARYAVFNLLHCAMAYRLTGDERFFLRAKEEMMNAAGFPDWNPDHFLDIGETSFAMALGYDWLFTRLSTQERALIRKAMVEKALIPAEAAYNPGPRKDRRGGWARTSSNWNQVCNGGILCAALCIADEEPELAARIVAGVRASLPQGMAVYAPDGEYPEGPGYWSFGTTYNVIAIAALESALGTDLGLSSAPGFDRTIDFVEAVHGPFGVPFNYADSTDDPQNSPARAWLSIRFRRSSALGSTRELLSRELKKEDVTPFDPTIQVQVLNRFFPLHAVWFPSPVDAPEERLPLALHFRGIADLAIFRSSWVDANALFLGLKAGENAFHHNHLDLGSFVLDADGVRWALDLGPDSYELPGYFDNKGRRWALLRANNLSHNTATPGGALQKTKIVAPIVSFGDNPDFSFAIADLTSAYPETAVRLQRGVAMLDRARVLVQDEFRPSVDGTPLRWCMATRARIALSADGRSAQLFSDGRSLRVETLSPSSAVFSVVPAKPPTAAENQNEGVQFLIIELPATKDRTTTLAVLLSPTSAGRPRLSAPVLAPLETWR